MVSDKKYLRMLCKSQIPFGLSLSKPCWAWHHPSTGSGRTDLCRGFLNNSLQLRLSIYISIAILGIALIAGILSFFSALNEAKELQDDVLLEIATLFKQQVPVPDASLNTESANDDESRIYTTLLANTQTSIQTEHTKQNPLNALPLNLADGLQTYTLSGIKYRVITQTLASGKLQGQRIAVAQQTAVRDEIARKGALQTLAPFLILIPLLLILVAWLIRQIFKPVKVLAQELDQQDARLIRSISTEHLPAEIRPFTLAINRLFSRVEQTLAAQQRFIADAAHELRTPMTALSLQAERLAQADMPDEAKQRLDTLRQGIARNQHLLKQLLSLAAIQGESTQIEKLERISISQIFRELMEYFYPIAENKGIDLGVTAENEAFLFTHQFAIFTLLKNLVDNAIRYTPSGGKVDLTLTVEAPYAIVSVRDNGRGIADAEKARVFDAFYRVLDGDETDSGSGYNFGSGLGLAIVRDSAQKIGAEVSIEDAFPHQKIGKRGLCVKVKLLTAQA